MLLEGLAADTSVIAYLMAAAGVLGILAKIINQITLHRLVKSAGNMPKSTHRLIKLVRSKYEHACMIRDSVENIDAFVEKYIYEYRGFLFRIHTWRQIEILSVWFAGILAALGASVLYFTSGFSESVYQYIAAGIAETVLLSVVMRLSDEPYKVNAVKMYMVDYLENICTFRLKRQGAREREFIDVISAESGSKNTKNAEEQETVRTDCGRKENRTSVRGVRAVRSGRGAKNNPEPAYASGVLAEEDDRAEESGAMDRAAKEEQETAGAGRSSGAAWERPGGLSINIEGEPRSTGASKAAAAEDTAQHAARNQNREDDGRPALREEAIRQILEEFLA